MKSGGTSVSRNARASWAAAWGSWGTGVMRGRNSRRLGCATPPGIVGVRRAPLRCGRRHRPPTPMARSDDDSAAAALASADEAVRAGRYPEALRVLESLHAHHPDEPKAHYLHGVAAAMLGDRGAAHEQFLRAARLAPGDAALQCYAAASCIERRELSQAARY